MLIRWFFQINNDFNITDGTTDTFTVDSNTGNTNISGTSDINEKLTYITNAEALDVKGSVNDGSTHLNNDFNITDGLILFS